MCLPSADRTASARTSASPGASASAKASKTAGTSAEASSADDDRSATAMQTARCPALFFGITTVLAAPDFFDTSFTLISGTLYDLLPGIGKGFLSTAGAKARTMFDCLDNEKYKDEKSNPSAEKKCQKQGGERIVVVF